jgi:thiamine phosphate synthase YjbQ (UPF0047 family)
MEEEMKSHTEYLVFETRKRREMVHITDEVEEIVHRSGVKDGLVLCFADAHYGGGVCERPGERVDRGYR